MLNAQASELLTKLLDYVIEQDKDVDPRGFMALTSKIFRRTQSELAEHMGVQLNLDDEDGPIWLRVPRLELEPLPDLPDTVLASCIAVSSDPHGSPPRAQRERMLEPAVVELGMTDEEFNALLDSLVADYTPKWMEWAERQRVRLRTIELYSQLFACKTQMEVEETAKPIELVWGMAMASWMLHHEKHGQVSYQYPLITQAVEISLDPKTLVLEVRPRNVPPRLEFDAIASTQVPLSAETEKAARQMLEDSSVDVSPYQPATFEPVARFVAGNLSERGRFDATDAIPSVGEDFVVTRGCVLLGRPKPSNYLHEDINRLKERISGGDALPSATLALVTPPSDSAPDITPVVFRGMSGMTREGHSPMSARELYFPLPYNQEQVTVVEQLERTDGVVVQGPPGTGKTHTIANIICHYLATGRKVLVTSKGEPALAVLQSKIPEEVRSLTVSLLAGDREGMRQFQASIESITHRITQLQPAQTETKIANLRSSITRAQAEQIEVDRRIHEVAMKHLTEIEVDGAPKRAEVLAEMVVDGLGAYDWFDDKLSLAEIHRVPLTDEEGAQLRHARRMIGEDLALLSVPIPAIDSLPQPSDVGEWHGALLESQKLDDAERDGSLLPLQSAEPPVMVHAMELKAHLDKVISAIHELNESGDQWWTVLRQRLSLKKFETERLALEALFSDVDKLEAARSAFLQRPVVVPADAFAQLKVREAIAKGAQTGKPFGMFAFGAGDTKALLSQMRVSGLEPSTADDWKHIQNYQKLHTQVLTFTTRWNEVAGLLGIPKFQGGVEILRELALTSTAARGVHALATQLDRHTVELAQKVFSAPPLAQLKGDESELLAIRTQLIRHLSKAQLVKAKLAATRFAEHLHSIIGYRIPELREFQAHQLGNAGLSVAAVTEQFAAELDELKRVHALKSHFEIVEHLTARIEEAGAPYLARRLRTLAAPESGDDIQWPVNWSRAWQYQRIAGHIAGLPQIEELSVLGKKRRELEDVLSHFYINLVSESAWLSTKNIASGRVLSALEAYKVAVRKFGKGTGASAGIHRRDAQKAMQDAQGAVPCWIMSHAKISETLPSHLGSFDLVIVDEASQSNLWALPAILRAKKILVVGDDKQVSPDGSFILGARIQELRRRFLSEQPYESVLTVDRSLYDLASTVFASQRVMLREHFRCVPTIISYSNQAFYGNQIQPLRIPKASERLDPPLVDIFARGGVRDGRDLNKLEAEAILEEIKAIVADPKMAGRTLGVVSLLGLDQAKHIDTLVRMHIDGKELLDREFYCGDARMFQGGERDIMFLSMVVSAGDCRALSGVQYEQRFNVAASRARDRMYLVRSVELAELSPADLRRGLLEHFARPTVGPDIDEQGLLELCESGFERQVFSALTERGYRVTPQVQAGAYRIDMVVEGADDRRLAIECDGDAFHGPDRWPADMARQRVLERAGWEFWRCFASSWKASREVCLNDLLMRLEALRIKPLGKVAQLPQLVETREYPKPQASSEDFSGPSELSSIEDIAIAK